MAAPETYLTTTSRASSNSSSGRHTEPITAVAPIGTEAGTEMNGYNVAATAIPVPTANVTLTDFDATNLAPIKAPKSINNNINSNTLNNNKNNQTKMSETETDGVNNIFNPSYTQVTEPTSNVKVEVHASPSEKYTNENENENENENQNETEHSNSHSISNSTDSSVFESESETQNEIQNQNKNVNENENENEKNEGNVTLASNKVYDVRVKDDNVNINIKTDAATRGEKKKKKRKKFHKKKLLKKMVHMFYDPKSSQQKENSHNESNNYNNNYKNKQFQPKEIKTVTATDKKNGNIIFKKQERIYTPTTDLINNVTDEKQEMEPSNSSSSNSNSSSNSSSASGSGSSSSFKPKNYKYKMGNIGNNVSDPWHSELNSKKSKSVSPIASHTKSNIDTKIDKNKKNKINEKNETKKVNEVNDATTELIKNKIVRTWNDAKDAVSTMGGNIKQTVGDKLGTFGSQGASGKQSNSSVKKGVNQRVLNAKDALRDRILYAKDCLKDRMQLMQLEELKLILNKKWNSFQTTQKCLLFVIVVLCVFLVFIESFHFGRDYKYFNYYKVPQKVDLAVIDVNGVRRNLTDSDPFGSYAFVHVPLGHPVNDDLSFWDSKNTMFENEASEINGLMQAQMKELENELTRLKQENYHLQAKLKKAIEINQEFVTQIGRVELDAKKLIKVCNDQIEDIKINNYKDDAIERCEMLRKESEIMYERCSNFLREFRSALKI